MVYDYVAKKCLTSRSRSSARRRQAVQDLVRGKAAISLLKAAEDGQLEELLIKGSLATRMRPPPGIRK